MQYGDPQRLPHELVRLMQMQIETLEKETSGSVGDAERQKYEERQDRIDQLCEQLRYLHPAA
jgi:hypothetical protein